MAKKGHFTRIILSTLFSSCLLGIGAWATFHFTHTTYQYAENIIVSEAERVKNTEVSKTNLVITEHTTLEDIATALYADGCITNKDYFWTF